jgi:hypothetical protein
VSSRRRAQRQYHELHWAMTSALAGSLQSLLFPKGADLRSERGVIAIVHRSTGRHRITLLLQDLIVPDEGEVTWSRASGLLFSPAYKSRATNQIVERPGAGIAFIHTHPGPSRSPFPPTPSQDDLDADAADLFAIGASLPDGVPLVAAIVSANGLWSAREYVFAFPTTPADARRRAFSASGGKMRYATATRVVGPGVGKRATDLKADGVEGAQGELSATRQDSSIRLWGDAGQRALSTLRVGVIGAGGVGSILSEHVARLGVGETVHVDFDVITEANLNRSQGATRDDAKRHTPKVAVAQRLAKMGATATGFTARMVLGSVVERETLPHLLDCDVIVNAADSPWARQVLDQLAFAHLIPVIHGGTTLKGDPRSELLIAGKCEVSATGPGHACSECAGVYTRADVTEAQESPDVRGRRRYLETGAPLPADEREPSVISFNTLVAGLMQLRLQALALSTTPDAIVGIQRYYPIEGTLNWTPLRECRPDCDRRETVALGDSYDLPLGRDLDFEAVRKKFGVAPFEAD